mmetsp:Transcript_27881/g.78555  ORF Transcript_27881/g.78555 Transcript_27881/m.78555 type:complete len:209 (-) Transcript_27881:851-1477(-)
MGTTNGCSWSRLAHEPWSSWWHADEATILHILPADRDVPARPAVCIRPLARGDHGAPAQRRGGEPGAICIDRRVLHVQVQDSMVSDRRAARVAHLCLRAQLPGCTPQGLHRLWSSSMSVLGEERHWRRLLLALSLRASLPVLTRRQGAVVPPDVLQDRDLPRPPREGMSPAEALCLFPPPCRAPPAPERRHELRGAAARGGLAGNLGE